MGFRSTRQHKVEKLISQNMYCMYSISAKSRRVQFALCVVLIENYSLLIVFFQYSYQPHSVLPFFSICAFAERDSAVNVLRIVVFLHCAMCELLSYYVFFPSLAIICPPFLFLLSIKVVFAFIFIHNLSAHFDTTCDTLKLESYCWGRISCSSFNVLESSFMNT